MLMDGPNLIFDLAQTRSDARSGKLSIEQLLDIIENQHKTIKRLDADKRRLTERLAQYEPKASEEAKAPEANAQAGSSYSLDAEEQRRQKRRGKKRRKNSPGRTPTQEKFAAAQKIEDIFPEGVDHAVCHLVRERAVWRLIDGQAVRVGYRIFAGPDGKEAPIPGVRITGSFTIA